MPIPNLLVDAEKESSTLHLSLPRSGFCHLYVLFLLAEPGSAILLMAAAASSNTLYHFE